MGERELNSQSQPWSSVIRESSCQGVDLLVLPVRLNFEPGYGGGGE